MYSSMLLVLTKRVVRLSSLVFFLYGAHYLVHLLLGIVYLAWTWASQRSSSPTRNPCASTSLRKRSSCSALNTRYTVKKRLTVAGYGTTANLFYIVINIAEGLIEKNPGHCPILFLCFCLYFLITLSVTGASDRLHWSTLVLCFRSGNKLYGSAWVNFNSHRGNFFVGGGERGPQTDKHPPQSPFTGKYF